VSAFNFGVEKMVSKTAGIIAVIVVVIIVVVAGVLAFMFTNTGDNSSGNLSGNNINIYCGEYGFGSTSSNIKSPGPTVTLDAGQSVTVTLHNVGSMPHNWAIVTAKTDGNTNLAFNGAQIASGTNPLSGGQSASTTFTVGQAGTYYYICQVDGHVSLGMWGTVTVK
jgi:plastocyanin